MVRLRLSSPRQRNEHCQDVYQWQLSDNFDWILNVICIGKNVIYFNCSNFVISTYCSWSCHGSTDSGAVSLVDNRAIKTIRTTFPITLILMEKSCCASSGSRFRLEGNSQTKVRLKLDANRKIIFEMWFNHKTVEIELQNNHYNAHNFIVTSLWLHFMLNRKHLILKKSSKVNEVEPKSSS